MAEKIQKARDEAAKERERKQELVALRGDITLRSLPTTGSHPYLARKRVAALDIFFEGYDILVPCVDIVGKLWGYQRILADGTKLFMSGQKVEGTFHRIKGSLSTVYIVEGYATGASVHMATDATVICAFHAGNLTGVAVDVSSHCPGVSVVICGDDDQWTPGNPGRSKAMLAGAAVGGRVVFPEFKDLEGRPTDFNDLHCREGLEVVSKALK